MHKNYRRKYKFRAKHHGTRWWPGHMLYSMRQARRESWQQRRTQARDLIQSGRYDDLPLLYRRDIYWKYW